MLAKDAAKGGPAADAGARGPALVLTAEDYPAEDPSLHKGKATIPKTAESEFSENCPTPLYKVAAEIEKEVNKGKSTDEPAVGDTAEGIAVCSINPGVPADSGGADGPAYTL